MSRPSIETAFSRSGTTPLRPTTAPFPDNQSFLRPLLITEHPSPVTYHLSPLTVHQPCITNHSRLPSHPHPQAVGRRRVVPDDFRSTVTGDVRQQHRELFPVGDRDDVQL